MTQQLHTKELKDNLLEKAAMHVGKLTQKSHTPSLAVVMVEGNPASEVYVSHKEKACAEVGINFKLHTLPNNTTQEVLDKTIQKLNDDASVTGILLQLPLPEHLDRFHSINLISAEKDVDGLSALNTGRTAIEDPRAIRPATPLGVMRILKWAGIKLQGKEVVMIGRSLLVGQPMALMLFQKNATVTVCHKETVDLTSHLKNADIIISATGCPLLVKGSEVKKGCTIIDVGISPNINASAKCKIMGDVCESVDGVAGAVTPVPGGVGPMTVATLITNIIDATYLQIGEARPAWDIPQR